MIKNIFYKIFAVSLSMTLILSSCEKNDKTALPVPTAQAEIGKHAMTISWDPISNADTYIYRFSDGASTSTTATSITFTELTAGTDYDFHLRAARIDGSYVNSEEAHFVFSTPAENVSLTAQVASATFDGISVTYNASDDINHINWSMSNIFDQNEDYVKFLSGSYTGTISDRKGTLTINSTNGLQPGLPAVIYMQAVSNDGIKGDIVELKATPAPVSFTPSLVSCGSFVATVDNFDSADYIGMGFLAMSTDAPSEWGMTATEIVQLYADYGMLDIIPAGEATMIELNGEPDVDHYIGLVYWGADYTAKDIKIINYNSGEYVDGAPAASINVAVKNITSSSADLVFTPNANTRGYFYRLYTKANYEKAFAQGESYWYDNPLDYIRELTAAGGSMDYREQVDSRTSLKVDTDYVLVCFPYNVNGTQGWGASVVKSFKTEQAAPSVPSVNAAPAEQDNQKILEIRKLLGRKLNK